MTPAGPFLKAMKLHRQYANINRRLRMGENLPFHATPSEYDRSELMPRMIRYPRIGVYAGWGTSHSWLWFIELFDRMGFHAVRCLDEHQICHGGLKDIDVLAISGGDTFAVAQGLGAPGAMALRNFLNSGGVYIGACAGAYLPMNSSKTHLNHFNFTDVKIANLTKHLPPAERLPHKYCTSYGCQYVYHPVREAVTLHASRKPPFFDIPPFSAPLYGGPAMMPSNSDWTLASYAGFTPKTQFLVNRKVAKEVLMGRAAALRIPWSKGVFYLFGPHFEHPGFPKTNKLIADAIFWDVSSKSFNKEDFEPETMLTIDRHRAMRLLRDLRRELSNARIVAVGLELMPIKWRIGAKVYEPQKFRVYIEAIWKRLAMLDKLPAIRLQADNFTALCNTAAEASYLLRDLKKAVDSQQDTTTIAEQILDCLHELAKMFFDIYFLNRNHETSSHHRRPSRVQAVKQASCA